MNYLQQFAEFTTIEEGMQNLKKAVELRDKMGGALYYNIMNEDCCEIASIIVKMGGQRDEIGKIFGEGTFY